jgi:hypothetical protein
METEETRNWKRAAYGMGIAFIFSLLVLAWIVFGAGTNDRRNYIDGVRLGMFSDNSSQALQCYVEETFTCPSCKDIQLDQINKDMQSKGFENTTWNELWNGSLWKRK